MDIGTVLTVLATGLVTLSGVALTQIFTSRRERLARDAARLDARSAAAQEAAREVAKLFHDEALLSRKAADRHEDIDDSRELWHGHWYAEAEPRLVLAIEAIPVPSAREQLLVVCDALGDWMYAQFKQTPRLYAVVDLSDLGRGIAASYMRGESPNSDQIAELHSVREVLQAVAAHREDQQQASA
ncbi:hypothetical protein [uncultured Microbacterium sp.]|uniref:hypothetical protein n=1 Tax=uncultured Microbacterium sp. TaxID=191216 RepID=UPI0025EE0317|nr:hypothetical protein [uncultured Microbacterium sp.]